MTLARRRKIWESDKPRLVSSLEQVFGDALWQDERPYDVTDRDMYMLFDVINDGLFGNKLDRSINKFVIKAERAVRHPEYEGLQYAQAAFMSGVVNGQERQMIFVQRDRPVNFYTATCAMIHEMIHMYDYHFGPMGSQYSKYQAVAGYMFNPIRFDGKGRPYVSTAAADNIRNAYRAGFSSHEQLPDELLAKIRDPDLNKTKKPFQYQMPARVDGFVKDSSGKSRPFTKPLPIKYRMDDLDGFYDVHGRYFEGLARKARDIGFDVRDVLTSDVSTKMTKQYEAESEPENVAQAICRSFRTQEHKAFDYRDEDNWFVEIT